MLVRDLQIADPFLEVWILVPNQLTRLHLRRVLARALGQAANLRFLTVNDLTHMLAEPLVLADGWRLLGEAAVDPLIQQIIDGLTPSLEYLAPVAASSGFRRALLRTRADLLMHQVTPEDLLRVEFRDHERGRKLRDIVRLIAAIDTRLRELRMYDANLLQTLALKAVNAGTPDIPPLVLYGLYDLPPLSRALMEVCFARNSAAVFLPYIDSDSQFKLTAPLKNWFISRGLLHEELQPSVCEPQVHFVLAPNEARVATEIVRDILHPPSQTANDFAVILPPSSTSLSSLLESRCATAGVAPFVYQARTLGDTAAGRGMLALADLLVADFESRSVARYLAAAPLGGADAALAGEWQRIAEEARITSGESSWRRSIERHVQQIEFHIERASKKADDEEDETLTALGRRLIVASGLRDFFERLSAAINSAVKARTWSAAVDILWSYYSDSVLIDREFADIVVQLDQASMLDLAGIPVTRMALRDFLCTTLATPGSRSGTLGKSLPLIAAREQCFGLTFATVLLPGYNEGTIPHADSQDPLLLDDDREAINKSLKVTLPQRRDWQQREAFWFAIAVSSATQGIVIYAARSDQNGRPLLVSPYFASSLTHYFGFDSLSSDIESFCASHPSCRIAAAHPLAGDLDFAIDAAEYHRIALRLAQTQRSAGPLAPLLNHADFQRGLTMERARFAAAAFGTFDGLLTSEDNRAELNNRYDPRLPIRATALEDYWKCPFRYAVIRELEAYAPESVTDIDPIPKYVRGTLLHNILQKYHDLPKIVPIAAPHYTWERLAAIAENEIRSFVARNNVGTRYALVGLREYLTEILRAYFDAYIVRSGAWSTMHVEADFGRGEGEFGEPLEINSGEATLRVKGRIDRWDEDQAGGRIRITDYKSGKIADKKSRASTRRLQIALYHAFAAQRKPKASVQSEYLHMHDADIIASQLAIGHEDALRVASELAADLRRGVFVPDPDSKDTAVCKSCRVKLACGAVRHSNKPLTPMSINGLRTTRSKQQPQESGDDDE